ncbi:hypothetical protein LINPERHAP1_LOCUS19553 [Linum perenne]
MHEDGAVNPRCPRVRFSEEEIAQFYKPWSKALVVRVLEKSFPYQALRRWLEFLWAKRGRIQVADLSNDFFLVRFSDVDDYHRAAFDGPWKMFDYYITVARWTPEFNEEEPIQTILTWVRLPKLPIHFFNKTVVSRIGDHIGKTVRLDLARARYARVCVEVDFSKPLLGKYMIGNRVFYVEYECLENLCYFCGMYGHKHDNCPDLAEPADSTPVVDPPKASEPVVAEEGDTGSWMTVSRRRKKKVGKQVQDTDQGSGSRFTILQKEQEEVVTAVGQGSGKEQVKPCPKATQDPPFIESLVTITKSLFPMPKADDKGCPPKQPLGDVTNTTSSSNSGVKMIAVATPPDNQQNESVKLVSVPVSYENPIFESDFAPSSVAQIKKLAREKSKVNKGSKAPPATLVGVKDKPRVKNYVPRGPRQTGNGKAKDGVKKAEEDKPPDPKC